MSEQAGDLLAKLGAYLAGVDVERVVESISAAMGCELAVARNEVETHIGEVRVAMRLVCPAINTDTRVLEVGSGIGLFSGFLRSIDVDVTELEPVGMGFEFVGEARAALADYTHPSRHLDIGVEQLEAGVHGPFDLIFSLNVLEHVADWRRALQACVSVMADCGQMIHAHPNYSVPYEPHFGVPLVPLVPEGTSRLLPDRIVDTDTWRSLNWITAHQVKRWCRQEGLDIKFRPGLLADALSRLSNDPLFRERHKGIARHGAVLATRLGLIGLLRRLPAVLSTPVEYTIRRCE